MIPIKIKSLEGTLTRIARKEPFQNALWYQSTAAMPKDDYWARNGTGDRITFDLEGVCFHKSGWLTADLMVMGDHEVVFELALYERDKKFSLTFFTLNRAQARIRFHLDDCDLKKWQLGREEAWLKPCCNGEVVTPEKIDRMELNIVRKSNHNAIFALTPLYYSDIEPSRITEPVLPDGALVDELGQWKFSEWAGKTKSYDEFYSRIHKTLNTNQPTQPSGRSKWGGCLSKRIDATGYFRTHHDNNRWWFVDPDGYLFWSAGLDCVRSMIDSRVTHLTNAVTRKPQSEFAVTKNDFGEVIGYDFLRENLFRAFGDDCENAWERITLNFLNEAGFNSIGNWSDLKFAQKYQFPYVRPLHFTAKHVKNIYRDFPDVMNPEFLKDARDFAQALVTTLNDPALIGYFLMNEPTWGFSLQTPAEGMLFQTESCYSRTAFKNWLQEKYITEEAISNAWAKKITFEQIERGIWTDRPTSEMIPDLETFSTILVEKEFLTLSNACKEVDPNHLNLGARYYTVPPEWAMKGMKGFDVFSVNCYQPKVLDLFKQITDTMQIPVLIGEWHFGALDAGLPGTGIGQVESQADRGKAYRIYVEDAASKPWCVGVHYFTQNDQSCLGRFDGENWNIGFIDVTCKPYGDLLNAARITHECLYDVILCKEKPFNDAPVYLPPLFS